MAIFSGFNNLGNTLRRATSDFNRTLGSINSFGRNLRGSISQIRNAVNNNPIVRTVNAVNNVRSVINNIDNLFSGTRTNLNNVGTANRMATNATQGVSFGATPATRTTTTATVSQNAAGRSADSDDWRVSLSIPQRLAEPGPMSPLLDNTNGRMVFPFNPVILMSQSANYSSITPTHSNYPFYAYQNSSVDAITITGEFFNENESDGQYWIGCVHFLRTITKMFYGRSSPLGNPPLISRLNGYGKHVLNDIPVVITNFTIDLPADIDYISTTVGEQVNMVPTSSQITVTCQPNYARRSHSKFNLNEFARGQAVGKPEGFI